MIGGFTSTLNKLSNENGKASFKNVINMSFGGGGGIREDKI